MIAFGLFDVSDERAEQLKGDLEPSERARHEAMAPYVAETLVAGLFDVVYSMEGSAEGAITIVPLTERHIKPGSMDDYRATMQEFAAAMGGPPPGMEQCSRSNTSRPGRTWSSSASCARTTGSAAREQNRAGASRWSRRIAPVHRLAIGIDTTFELVEELSPAHA